MDGTVDRILPQESILACNLITSRVKVITGDAKLAGQLKNGVTAEELAASLAPEPSAGREARVTTFLAAVQEVGVELV